MQLVINDSLGDEAIVDVLKSVRSIVGHFHCSTTSRQLLNSVQTQLELPNHQLCQEVSNVGTQLTTCYKGSMNNVMP